MEKSTLKKIGIVALALIGCAAVLGCIAILTTLLTIQNTTLASVLPGKETQLLFMHPSQEQIIHMKKWLPVIDSIPVIKNTEALALVVQNQKITPVIIMRTISDQPEILSEWKKVERTPFIFYAKDDIEILINNEQPSLDQYTHFDALSQLRTPDEQWLFLQSNIIQTANLSLIEKSILLLNAQSVAISFQDTSTRIDHYIPTIERLNPVQPSLESFIQNPTFSIRTSNSKELYELLSSTLTTQQRSIASVLLENSLMSGLGNSMSMEYDFLPLLYDNFSYAVNATESGNSVWSLIGTMHSEEEITRRLSALHANVELETVSTEVRERLLDDKFTAKDIRIVSQEQATETNEKNGWIIHSNKYPTGEIKLVSSQKGTKFGVTNTQDSLSIIGTPYVSSLAHPQTIVPTNLLAGGSLQTAAFIEFLRTLEMVDTSPPSLLESFLTSATIQWSILQRGTILSLSIQTL